MEKTQYYTGIGSRKTPPDILFLMTAAAGQLSRQGWVARSGGAKGADQAFGQGDLNCEIFLPWKGFFEQGQYRYSIDLWDKAERIAADPRVYPGFRGIKNSIRELKSLGLTKVPGGKSIRSLEAILKLHTRNVFQVLGPDLRTPSKFCVCWTPDGAVSQEDYKAGVTGGTGTAINLASLYNIPVANLRRDDHRKIFEKLASTGEFSVDSIRSQSPEMSLF